MCSVCLRHEPLATAQDHHRTPRAFGGTDDPSNRVWLCASCHARLHRVQDFLVGGKVASATELCQAIFPTDARARGELWTFANEAARAELEVKDVFATHKTHVKVTLNMEIEVWALVKALAKERRTSAADYAAHLLRSAVQGK